MTNPLKGEVSFKSGEDEYRLVFTIDALISLEERFNATVQQLGEMLGDNLRLTDLRAVFHAGLAEYHGGLDEKAAGRIMSELGITEAGTLVGRAFAGAFNSGEEAKEVAGPRKRSAGTGRTASTSGSTSTSEATPHLDA